MPKTCLSLLSVIYRVYLSLMVQSELVLTNVEGLGRI